MVAQQVLADLETSLGLSGLMQLHAKFNTPILRSSNSRMAAARTQQEVYAQLRGLQQECQHLSQKIAELDVESHSHECVAWASRGATRASRR